MKGLILAGHTALQRAGGPVKSFCPNPSGRDLLVTLDEVREAPCGDCKWLSMLLARQLIDAAAAGDARVREIELCMTVSGQSEEHVFLRVNRSQFRDAAVEAGMPVRPIGAFIAETVWRAPPER